MPKVGKSPSKSTIPMVLASTKLVAADVQRLPVGTNPTDLDLTPDGTKAVVLDGRVREPQQGGGVCRQAARN